MLHKHLKLILFGIFFCCSVCISSYAYAAAYGQGDIAPKDDPDGILDVGDAILALQCAIGMEETTDTILDYGNVAPVTIVTDEYNVSNPDEDLNVGDAVVILRGSVGALEWDGMALLEGQRYYFQIPVSDQSLYDYNIYGYEIKLSIGNGAYEGGGSIVYSNDTGTLNSDSTYEHRTLDENTGFGYTNSEMPTHHYDAASKTFSVAVAQNERIGNMGQDDMLLEIPVT